MQTTAVSKSSALRVVATTTATISSIVTATRTTPTATTVTSLALPATAFIAATPSLSSPVVRFFRLLFCVSDRDTCSCKSHEMLTIRIYMDDVLLKTGIVVVIIIIVV